MKSLTLNTGTYLNIFLWMTMVFCGTVQYFTQIGAVLWLPLFMAFTMVMLLLMQTRFSPVDLDPQDGIVITLFVGFFMMAMISTYWQDGGLVTVVGLKNEIALSLILFCMVMGFCRESQIYRLIRSCYLIFYIQWPIIMYQVLVCVPHRVAFKGPYEMWDSVVGTFGGNPMGGGNSASLGFFCLLIMLLKVSEYKHGLSSLLSVGIHLTLSFVLCVVGEVKFVILLAPVLLIYVWFAPSYIKGMKTADLKVVLGILAGTGVLMTLAITVLASGYKDAFGGEQNKNVFEIFFDSISYIFNPDYILPNGDLGRMTTIFFWAKHSDLHGISNVFFGYGLNTTNSGSTVSPGFLNKVLNVTLDSTSLSVLLWEVGLVGTTLFFSTIWYILRVGKPKPLFDREKLTEDDIRLMSFQPALIAFGISCLLSLPYSQILTLVPNSEFIFYFSLGAIMVIRKSLLKAASQGYGC